MNMPGPVSPPDAMPALMSVFVAGLVIGGGLMAGMRRHTLLLLEPGEHYRAVGTIVSACLVSDTIFLMLGVSVLAELARDSRWLLRFVLALLVTAYGLRLCGRAVRRFYRLPLIRRAAHRSRPVVLRAALARVWSDPFVWLHLLAIPALLAVPYDMTERAVFLTGLVTAETGWCVALGYGAQRLWPVFSRAFGWRVLDVMAGLALLVTAGQLWFFALAALRF